MALKAIVTSEEYEKLPEATRAYYSGHGEGYRLDVEGVGGWALDDIDGLRSTLTKLKASNADLKKAAAQYEGFDLDEARQALERVKSLEGNEGKVKDQIEAIKRNLAETHEKEKAKWTETNQALEQQLQRHLIESAAAMALGKHKGDPDLLMPHIAQTVRAVRGEDGKYVLRVLNPDGTEVLSKQSGKGAEPMGVEEYVGGALKSRFPAAFEGTGATGSGATGSQRSGSGTGRFTIPADVARNDPRAYQRVRAEAEKAGQTVTIIE